MKSDRDTYWFSLCSFLVLAGMVSCSSSDDNSDNTPMPTPQFCADTCATAANSVCEDGRPGEQGGCLAGTDCSDCGPNPNIQFPPGSAPSPYTPSQGGQANVVTLAQCTCPSDYYCPSAESLSIPTNNGGTTMLSCGDGGQGCLIRRIYCPGFGPGAFDTDLDYECRVGPQGLGCYGITTQDCSDAQACPPPRELGFDFDWPGPNLPTYRTCVELDPVLFPQDLDGFHPNSTFDLDNSQWCRTWSEVDGTRYDFRNCGNPANLSTSWCEQFYRDANVPSDPRVDPETCRGSPSYQAVDLAISDLIGVLTTLPGASTCVNGCATNLATCRSGAGSCADLEACLNVTLVCLQGCAG